MNKIGLYVGLAVQAAGIVWWASNLQSEVQHNDFQIQMIAKDVEKNSSFTELWPAGKWGSGELENCPVTLVKTCIFQNYKNV